MRNNDKEQQRNYEKLPGNKTKFPANNENGHHTNKMHFHIKARDLIVIIVIAFIFVVGHFGGNDTDDPIPTTDSTKNPITSISFEYNTEDTVELDPDDYEYVYFRFNTGRYTFDDIQLVSTNPDVCKLEFDDEAPSSTLDCKISALSAGESVVYIQTPDGAVKSPEIKVTVLPLTIERIHFDQGVNNKLDMYIGETIEDKISVSANADITSEHITLVSSNPDVVQFEYIDLKDGAFFTYINYKIHALSDVSSS